MNLPRNTLYILDALNNCGYESYVVGGCVRDSLLKQIPTDWDICTQAMPNEVITIFAEKGIKVIPTGLAHGTVTLVINGEKFEVTTYRRDGAYQDHRRPDLVEFSPSIEVDLSRRDFTVNAIAYSPEKGFVDPYKGQQDLEARIIKSVGNPNLRFNEDALRLMRAIRFTSQLGFKLEELTKKSIRYNAHLVKKISPERIRDEFCKMLLTTAPSISVQLLKKLGMLKWILPELEKLDLQVLDHTLSVLDHTPNQLVVRLTALFYEIDGGNDAIPGLMKRLKFDNETTHLVSLLIKERLKYDAEISVSDLKRLISRVGAPHMEYLFLMQEAYFRGSNPPQDLSIIESLRTLVKQILDEKQPLFIKDLAINGKDLMNIGYPPGKEIGLLLNHLLDKVLENSELNTKEMLLKLVKVTPLV